MANGRAKRPSEKVRKALERIGLDRVVLAEDGRISFPSSRFSIADQSPFWARFFARGGALSWAPWPQHHRLLAWTVSPLGWRESVGVLGSRLGRHPDLLPHFSHGIRATGAALRGTQMAVLLPKTSPAEKLVTRALQRAGVKRVRVDASHAKSWTQWRRAVSRADEAAAAAALLSPSLFPSANSGGHWTAPLADQVVAFSSQRLFAPHVRERGFTAELLCDRLRQGVEVDCWLPADMHRNRLTHELQQLGASVHLCENPHKNSNKRPRALSIAVDHPEEILDLPKHIPRRSWQAIRRLLRQPCLVHCTRAPYGPWPLETEHQYLDAILATCEPRNALASLKRILHRRMLLRSASGLRGGHRAVCFSAADLDWIAQARTYRTHRMRWDYEPYGICFLRSCLKRLGARPVTYGDDELWDRLNQAEQMFFQPQTSSNGAIDWRMEQEWRLPRDLNLDDLAFGDAVAFTKTDAEAAEISAASPFPVVALQRLVNVQSAKGRD